MVLVFKPRSLVAWGDPGFLKEGALWRVGVSMDYLKVPKRENFSLAFFTLSEPIWVCDLGTGTKIDVFINCPLISKVFWFFAAHSVCGKKEKNLR